MGTTKQTEIDRLTRELRACENRYRSLTETSVDAILTTDKGDKILTWNKGAEGLFGHGQDIVGQPVEMIIPERYQQAHQDGMRRYLETGRKRLIGSTVELQALRKDGTEVPIELSLSTWEGENGPLFGAIIRDISERKTAEQMRDRVQRMMRHDLRSPLIGITGLAGMLQKSETLTKREQKSIDMIQDLGKKTLKAIDRSRDLFQMEQGQYRLSPEALDLVEVLKTAKGELDPLRQKKGLHIELKIHGKTAEWDDTYEIHGDQELLEMLFANLIKNAIEASPQNETVQISIGSKNEKRTGTHIVDIHNKGVIPEEIRTRLFEPYTTSGKKGGTGLGTHSAQLVARTHQGKIYFTTAENEGTHMMVELPRELKKGL
jgi:PAS domain S-box-containing protein